jgi:alpha-glucuronidase
LLLFFHRVPYTHKLHSGKTVIQHIYDSEFEGVEKVQELITRWQSLKGKIDDQRHTEVLASFHKQLASAKVWRDAVTGYFFKHSKIADEKGRIK